MDYAITDEMIEAAESAEACDWSVRWLRAKPRTWHELVEHRPEWAVWAMANIPSLPIDLDGLGSFNCAEVMIARLDCPVNPALLFDYDLAWVMRLRGNK